jgi:hypothetical protein
LLLAASGCGSGGAAAPAVVTAKPAVAARPAPEMRCLAAGRVIAALQPDADDKRAQAVSSLCTRTGWAAAVVECVDAASTPDDTQACIAKLEPMQHEALSSLELSWDADDFDTLFATGATPAGTIDAPDGDDEASCANAIGDASRFAPAIPLASGDRTWASALRAAALAPVCTDWTADVRGCLAKATTAADATACDAPQLARVVGDSDALVKRLAAKRAQPSEVTCARASAVHYADAAWTGKLAADVTGEQRRKVIADSRALLTKACDADSWSVDLRACIVVGGGDACFTAAGVPGGAWGFPALGVFAATGIAACDAYTRAVDRLLACGKVSAPSKERIARSSQQTLASLLTQARDDAAELCQRADEEIEEMETNIGCAP